jgi:hypothetical protein
MNVLVILLSVIFLLLGTAKILALGPMRERAAEVGFSSAAYRRIGVLEVAGAIGLLVGLVEPVIGALAAAGLLLLLVGAMVAHVRHGDGPREFAPAMIFGLLMATYLAVNLGAAAA